MKTKAFWLMLCLLIVAGFATVWVLAQRNTSSGELTEQQAVNIAHRFLQNAGLQLPSTAPRAQLRTKRDGWRVWQVEWTNRYSMEIDARTGQVYWFANYGREYEQVKRIGRDRQPKIASREVAEQYCWQLAQRLGLPKDAYLKRLRIVAEGEAGDANRAGSVSANFEVRYFGYTFLSEGGEVAFSVDPLDGTLMFFSARAPTVIESHDVRISQTEAVSKAKQIYADWYRTHRSPHQGKYTGRVEIGYVYPNGVFGGKRYPPQVPYRARLAYAVYFGEEAVWIDAADGSVLGGLLLK
ncbi:MAG: hypothetical protein KatS3mg022_1200 [Armatimonadota bacterium]|nr:MAG: hypothetical protein KatS3mg022_1200 [Armatimonadota bacterium]